ncbi:MAG: D-glycero-beta-D-manno-heptose 1,7-bisphosphate 7-phosphatase [Betaproteobacteria bacterium]|nr:D-glycero-beta-D-manno-heptose 1,7-bisphosphate 7-phosphatase [Betaproteobacteria bacterium]
MKKAAFLDRDGVINIDKGYVYKWCDFEFVPGAVDAMKAISQLGFEIIVATNQSGIARGYYSEDDFLKLSKSMIGFLDSEGVRVAGIYYCPHHAEGVVKNFAISCSCRKPLPGMLLKAKDDHNIDLSASIMVGDKSSDILAGRNAGVGKAFMVVPDDYPKNMDGIHVDAYFSDLRSCANFLHEERNSAAPPLSR